MTADPAKAKPAKLKLVAEYRTVLTFPNAVMATKIHASLQEAEDAALRHVRAGSPCTWQIERRLVSQWVPMPTPVGVRYDTDDPGAEDGQQG